MLKGKEKGGIRGGGDKIRMGGANKAKGKIRGKEERETRGKQKKRGTKDWGESYGEKE